MKWKLIVDKYYVLYLNEYNRYKFNECHNGC